MHIDKSITFSQINFNSTSRSALSATNGCMPGLDSLFAVTTKAIYDNALALSSLKSLDAYTATNGSYVLQTKNKTPCTQVHTSNVAFTTKKACETFLSELVDIHSGADTYGYKEYYTDTCRKWLPEELEIVENTILDTFEQSMISPILINPYLPLYNITGVTY